MVTRHLLTLLAAVVLAGSAGWAERQTPDADEMKKFVEQHRYTLQLETMLTTGLMECERWKTTAISAEQAKKLHDILQSLRWKSSLSQDQARSSMRDIQRALDFRQQSAVDRAVRAGEQLTTSALSRGARTPSATNTSRSRTDLSRMKNFNPFCPSTSSPRYQSDVERYYRLISFLKARAEGKTATLYLRPPEPMPFSR